MTHHIDAALALLTLGAAGLLYLVALAPTWLVRLRAYAVDWFLVALALSAVGMLLVIVAILETFEKRRPMSDEELDRRFTVGLRSARRRGLIPEDVQ